MEKSVSRFAVQARTLPPLHGAAFIGCQRQAGEGFRLFPRADQARGRRGKTFAGYSKPRSAMLRVALGVTMT